MMPLMNILVAAALLGHIASGHRYWRSGSSHKFLHNEVRHALHHHEARNVTAAALHKSHLSLPPHSCGVDVTVNAESNKKQKCPAECPLYAEEHGDDAYCTFRCVQPTIAACKALGDQTPIPDAEMAMCRSCMIPGCDKCAVDGTDTCVACSGGFTLNSKGLCDNNAFMYWCIAFGILGVIVVVLVVWIVDMARRESVNQAGLDRALETRSLAKLRMPAKVDRAEDEKHRPVWDLWTNLCSQMVAGPGILLDFNYQAVVILWAFGVAIAWCILASAVDGDLFVLGTKRGESARDMCIVVAWGYETQQRLLPVKAAFVLGLYVVSFVLILAHAVRQLRMFQVMDVHATHADFAAVLTGLPEVRGDELIEDLYIEEALKKVLADATKQSIVGVSVCWDFFEVDDLVMTTVSEDLLIHEAAGETAAVVENGSDEAPESRRESARTAQAHHQANVDRVLTRAARATQQKTEGRSPRLESKDVPKTGPIESLGREQSSARGSDSARSDGDDGGKYTRQRTIDMTKRQMLAEKGFLATTFHYLESLFLNPTTQKLITKGRKNKARVPMAKRKAEQQERIQQEQDAIYDKVIEMKSGGEAFVVFHSEQGRDAAVEAVKDGIVFRGETMSLKECVHEPDSINWKNFQNRSTGDKVRTLLFGIGVIFTAIMAWTFMFYLPYAWFVSSSNYKYGQEPGAVASITFGMLVCVGNVIMYLVCAEVADRVQLHYHTQRELCYMLLYAFACFFNVLLDMIFSYYIAYWMMVGSDMRTYGGAHLKDLHTFKQRFESYAMQRELGNLLYAYSFPSTFLIPFLIEPWATIYAPYKIMCFIVRSHDDIGGADAEQLMESIPMDLSRYADVWLNVTLGVLIFFFPGGLTQGIFFWMAIAHIWIYVFDHFRVLRCIPHCNYSNMTVDWYATWMMSIPLGLLIVCAVFKGNCQTPYMCFEEDDNDGMVKACGLAFLIHEVVFTLALRFLVPCLGRKDPVPTEKPYEMVAGKHAPSYFNTNPVHCLRSLYVYQHETPLDYCLPGKEHIMRHCPEIGAYFQDDRAEVENIKKDFDLQDTKEFFKTSSIRFKDHVKTQASHVRKRLSVFTKKKSDADGKDGDVPDSARPRKLTTEEALKSP